MNSSPYTYINVRNRNCAVLPPASFSAYVENVQPQLGSRMQKSASTK